MKIVLLKDVQGVGRKGEVKTVSDGHALNFLIPRKLAEMGTPQATAKAERLRSEQEIERRIQTDLLEKNLKTLESVRLEVAEKANEKGHLFSGIHKERIVEELKKQKGINLPAEFLVLERPIKEVGEHAVSVKASETTATFTVAVKQLP